MAMVPAATTPTSAWRLSRLSDPSPDTDAEIDLFSFAALQQIESHSVPAEPSPVAPPPIPPTSPTAVNLRAPAPVETPAVTGGSGQPESIDATDGDDVGGDVGGDIMDPDWPRCRKPKGRAPRVYKTVGSVPEMTEEQLARSPKLRKWRDRERNKLNAREYRRRARERKARLDSAKQKVCRACFRLYVPTTKRSSSPYCTEKCGTAWSRISHCFDGDAAWLYRIRAARAVIERPEGHSAEAIMASHQLLTYESPDYEPHEPRPGSLQSALMKALLKLRRKWAPFAAEAIRQGKADTMLKRDMLELIGPMLRGETQ